MGSNINLKRVNGRLLGAIRRRLWSGLRKLKTVGVQVVESCVGPVYVDLDEELGGNIYADGVHEHAETFFLDKELVSNWVCLDIGANFGYFTILMAKCCPEGLVLAIEPIGTNCDLIKKNIEKNSIENARLESAALSVETGQRSFTLSKDSAYSGFESTNRRANDRTINVDTISSKDLLRKYEIERIDFIKIDVEGCELQLLSDLLPLLGSNPPKMILCEVNPVNMETYGLKPESILQAMAELGYSAFEFDEPRSIRLQSYTGNSVMWSDNVLFCHESQKSSTEALIC